MPQLAAPLRGHELAKDGLPPPITLPPSLIFSQILNHNLSPFSDVTILRPATADEVADTGTIPDQGAPLPLASTIQRFNIWILFNDFATGGFVSLILRKNGVDTAFQLTNIGAVPGGGIGLSWGSGNIRFNAGDTWEVAATQEHLGLGAGCAFVLTCAFYA